jgi:serine protease Do
MNHRYLRTVSMMLLCAVVAHGAVEEITLSGGFSVRGDVLREREGALVVDLGFDVVRIPAEAVVDRRGSGGAAAAGSVRAADLHFEADLEPSELGSLVDRFGEAVVQVSTPAGLGSGFVIHPSGYLLTNFHVIEGETRITITRYLREQGGLRKENFDEVEIVALNPAADLALLRVRPEAPTRFIHVFLGQVGRLSAGDPVFAIGSPLGLERTVTQGIVSTTARAVSGMAVIQTTAQINPGNSGGPLFNLRGEVVGVINMKVSMAEGLGFAIPVSVALDFLRNRAAFAYDRDNPNTGYHYLDPPRRRESGRETDE